MRFLQYFWCFCLFFLFYINGKADVKSDTGTINFDSDSDSQAEMKLNSTGLGIGTTAESNLHVNGNAIVTETLTIGSSTGSSNLVLDGTMGFGVQTVSTNSTLDSSSLVLVNSASGNIKITLPYAGNMLGRMYTIKKTSTQNSVYVRGDYIDENYAMKLSEDSLEYVELISSGNQQWSILATNGNTTLWNPENITTSAWYDAADLSSMTFNASTGNVSQWNDKSGNDNHLTQADANLQPELVNSRMEFVNGKMLSKSNGTNLLIASGNHSAFFVHDIVDASTSSIAATTFAIFKNRSTSGTDPRRPHFMYNRSNNRFFHQYSSGGTTVNANSVISTLLGRRLITGVWDDGNGLLAIDGTTLDTETAANPTDTTHDVLEVGDTATQDLTITFYEIIFLAQEIDSATNQKIEGYLAWKWGLEDNLDASHPHKAHPPL